MALLPYRLEFSKEGAGASRLPYKMITQYSTSLRPLFIIVSGSQVGFSTSLQYGNIFYMDPAFVYLQEVHRFY